MRADGAMVAHSAGSRGATGSSPVQSIDSVEYLKKTYIHLKQTKETMGRLIIYATDIHGETEIFEKMLDKAIRKKAVGVVIGGDLNSHMTMFAVNSIEIQRAFFEHFLIPLLEKFRKKSGIPVFIMMGNDDHSMNMDLLEKAEKDGTINVMHNKVCEFGRTKIVGYTNINPSDWLIFPINDWVKEENKIKKDLEKLTANLDSNFILATHAPPINTDLDVHYMGINVGSEAIRNIIEDKQPYLTLHGHIHESPMMTGAIVDKIGKSVCVNPGNARIVAIDLDKKEVVKI